MCYNNVKQKINQGSKKGYKKILKLEQDHKSSHFLYSVEKKVSIFIKNNKMI